MAWFSFGRSSADNAADAAKAGAKAADNLHTSGKVDANDMPNTNSGASGSSLNRRETGSGDDGPNSRTTTENPDGSSITKYTDGTTVTKDKDGINTTVEPDGTTIIKNTDGTTIVKNKDGKVLTKDELAADGRHPDGTFKTREELVADAKKTSDNAMKDANDAKGTVDTPESARMKYLRYSVYGVGLGSMGLAGARALEQYLKKNGKVYNIIAIESVQDTSDNNMKDSSGNFLKDSSGNFIKDPSSNFLKDSSGNIIKDASGNNTIMKGLKGYKTKFIIESDDNFTKNGTCKLDETNSEPIISPGNYYIDSVIAGRTLIIKTNEKVVKNGTKGKMTYYTNFLNEYAQGLDEFINGPLDKRKEDGSVDNPSLLGQISNGLKDIFKSLGLDSISSDTINLIMWGVGIFIILLFLFGFYKITNSFNSNR